MALISSLMQLPNQLVLGAAFAFMALVLVGGIVRAEASGAFGSLMRVVGNAGLLVSFGITLAQLAGAWGSDGLGVGTAHAAEITMSGNEARVPMAPDGHFWVEARINGVSQRFLIDTGATYTTISQDVADSAGVVPGAPEDSSGGRQIVLHTANGDAAAQFATIDRLQVGGIEAEAMKAVVAPGIGSTNVLGMNFLSSLGGWRVEDNTLILTPKG